MTANGWRVDVEPPRAESLDVFAGLRVTHPSGAYVVHRVGWMLAHIFDDDGRLVGSAQPVGTDEHGLGQTLSEWLAAHP